MNPNGEDIVQKIVLTTDEASAQKSTRTINDARAQVQGLAGDLQKVSSSGTGASVQFNSVAEAAARLGLSEAQIAALTNRNMILAQLLDDAMGLVTTHEETIKQRDAEIAKMDAARAPTTTET